MSFHRFRAFSPACWWFGGDSTPADPQCRSLPLRTVQATVRFLLSSTTKSEDALTNVTALALLWLGYWLDYWL